jgi:RNA processing factor Prp31
MELILKTNNETSIAKILALAKRLDVYVEQRDRNENKEDIQKLKERILQFKADEPLSFGDPAEWQKNERNDRKLPFSE